MLYPYQADAVRTLRNGNILVGGVGSGKSRTSLAYYYIKQGGKLYDVDGVDGRMVNPKDLYIITTARKRDSREWDQELIPFGMYEGNQLYSQRIVIDSWNNIGKYVSVTNSFFIFDEQRVVGYGAWVHSFLKIVKSNDWILLSATPGDTWMDYIPVFIANGFYKNKTEFCREHVVYKRISKFYQVDHYVSTKKLERFRDQILVNMDFERKTVAHHETIMCDYNKIIYKDCIKDKWNPFTQKPIENAGECCQTLRMIVNTDPSRVDALVKLVKERKKAIIFYNYNYELELIKSTLDALAYPYTEWNGNKHEGLLDGEKWCYLVQYSAGAEAWNCITTDTIIFYSQNYSYRIMLQASGRIDRLNTPYSDLYYYHMKSTASIDVAITRALREKKKFNEEAFINGR